MAFFINTTPPNSTTNRDGRYVQGGVTDIYDNRLGWWEKRKINKNESDITVSVLEYEQGRADLISFRVYGKSEYGWLILQYNNISDPVTELVTGTKLILPSNSRLIFDIVSKPIGGNIV